MEPDELKWIDVRDFGLAGKGWTDTESFFHRFPARAKAVVRPEVWERSTNSSGLRVHFSTDSSALGADWTVQNEPIAGDKFGASCKSGLDLYVRHEGRWHWCSLAWPDAPGRSRKRFFGDMPPGKREYMLYLPLLNVTTALSLGIAPDAKLSRPRPQPGKPICFYGTSVVHGGCASRPGMTYPAILGRRLDRPYISLGFSGEGRSEPEVAQLLAELDPCFYVIDSLPNTPVEVVTERIDTLVRILRKAHRNTPIVLVEHLVFQDELFVASHRERTEGRNLAFNVAFKNLLKAGVKGLHRVSGKRLLGSDGEATVDGCHPTDLGFMRMADALEPVLRKLL